MINSAIWFLVVDFNQERSQEMLTYIVAYALTGLLKAATASDICDTVRLEDRSYTDETVVIRTPASDELDARLLVVIRNVTMRGGGIELRSHNDVAPVRNVQIEVSDGSSIDSNTGSAVAVIAPGGVSGLLMTISGPNTVLRAAKGTANVRLAAGVVTNNASDVWIVVEDGARVEVGGGSLAAAAGVVSSDPNVDMCRVAISVTQSSVVAEDVLDGIAVAAGIGVQHDANTHESTTVVLSSIWLRSVASLLQAGGSASDRQAAAAAGALGIAVAGGYGSKIAIQATGVFVVMEQGSLATATSSCYQHVGAPSVSDTCGSVSAAAAISMAADKKTEASFSDVVVAVTESTCVAIAASNEHDTSSASCGGIAATSVSASGTGFTSLQISRLLLVVDSLSTLNSTATTGFHGAAASAAEGVAMAAGLYGKGYLSVNSSSVYAGGKSSLTSSTTWTGTGIIHEGSGASACAGISAALGHGAGVGVSGELELSVGSVSISVRNETSVQSHGVIGSGGGVATASGGVAGACGLAASVSVTVSGTLLFFAEEARLAASSKGGAPSDESVAAIGNSGSAAATGGVSCASSIAGKCSVEVTRVQLISRDASLSSLASTGGGGGSASAALGVTAVSVGNSASGSLNSLTFAALGESTIVAKSIGNSVAAVTHSAALDASAESIPEATVTSSVPSTRLLCDDSTLMIDSTLAATGSDSVVCDAFVLSTYAPLEASETTQPSYRNLIESRHPLLHKLERCTLTESLSHTLTLPTPTKTLTLPHFFDPADLNDDGVIDVKEMDSVLQQRAAGQNPGPAAITGWEIIQSLDKNGDRVLNSTEVETGDLRNALDPTRVQAFAIADVDRDGLLSQTELDGVGSPLPISLAQELPVSVDEFRQIPHALQSADFDQADADNNGLLSRKELTQIIQPPPTSLQLDMFFDTAGVANPRKGASGMTLVQFQNLPSTRDLGRFVLANADGDGTINRSELSDWLMKNEVNISVDELSLFTRLDVDNSGSLNLTEFVDGGLTQEPIVLPPSVISSTLKESARGLPKSVLFILIALAVLLLIVCLVCCIYCCCCRTRSRSLITRTISHEPFDETSPSNSHDARRPSLRFSLFSENNENTDEGANMAHGHRDSRGDGDDSRGVHETETETLGRYQAYPSGSSNSNSASPPSTPAPAQLPADENRSAVSSARPQSDLYGQHQTIDQFTDECPLQMNWDRVDAIVPVGDSEFDQRQRTQLCRDFHVASRQASCVDDQEVGRRSAKLLSRADCTRGVRNVMGLDDAVLSGDARVIYRFIVPMAFDRACRTSGWTDARRSPGSGHLTDPFNDGEISNGISRSKFRLFLQYLRHYIGVFCHIDSAEPSAQDMALLEHYSRQPSDVCSTNTLARATPQTHQFPPLKDSVAVPIPTSRRAVRSPARGQSSTPPSTRYPPSSQAGLTNRSFVSQAHYPPSSAASVVVPTPVPARYPASNSPSVKSRVSPVVGSSRSRAAATPASSIPDASQQDGDSLLKSRPISCGTTSNTSRNKNKGGSVRDLLMRFFSYYNSEKLDAVDELEKKYADQYDELRAALMEKYGPDPESSLLFDRPVSELAPPEVSIVGSPTVTPKSCPDDWSDAKVYLSASTRRPESVRPRNKSENTQSVTPAAPHDPVVDAAEDHIIHVVGKSPDYGLTRKEQEKEAYWRDSVGLDEEEDYARRHGRPMLRTDTHDPVECEKTPIPSCQSPFGDRYGPAVSARLSSRNSTPGHPRYQQQHSNNTSLGADSMCLSTSTHRADPSGLTSQKRRARQAALQSALDETEKLESAGGEISKQWSGLMRDATHNYRQRLTTPPLYPSTLKKPRMKKSLRGDSNETSFDSDFSLRENSNNTSDSRCSSSVEPFERDRNTALFTTAFRQSLVKSNEKLILLKSRHADVLAAADAVHAEETLAAATTDDITEANDRHRCALDEAMNEFELALQEIRDELHREEAKLKEAYLEL